MYQKVVLIDDDPDDHEIFAMALVEAIPDAESILYDSAEKALNELSKLTTGLPDYIFLDLNMPRMNGMQFLELMKKQGPLVNVPVIIYSTSILPSIKARAVELGASDFLAKPASQTELIKNLKKILAS